MVDPHAICIDDSNFTRNIKYLSRNDSKRVYWEEKREKDNCKEEKEQETNTRDYK